MLLLFIVESVLIDPLELVPFVDVFDGLQLSMIAVKAAVINKAMRFIDFWFLR
jgi:hypothetical protein